MQSCIAVPELQRTLCSLFCGCMPLGAGSHCCPVWLCSKCRDRNWSPNGDLSNLEPGWDICTVHPSSRAGWWQGCASHLNAICSQLMFYRLISSTLYSHCSLIYGCMYPLPDMMGCKIILYLLRVVAKSATFNCFGSVPAAQTPNGSALSHRLPVVCSRNLAQGKLSTRLLKAVMSLCVIHHG